MQTIEIKEGQVLIDVAMQYCGNAARLFDIAQLNGGLSTTVVLPVGTKILVPDAFIEDQKTADEFKNKQLVPASNDDADDFVLGGIGFMAVGVDFKVS
jgi:hypothetical protein